MPALVVVLALAALGFGCAVGNTHGYDQIVANVPYQGTRKVAVATEDQRPYVLDADKGPQFVGLSRGGYGNPFNVTTSSGHPLADDMTQALERSLDAKGFDAVALQSSLRESDAALVAKGREAGTSRIVILSLREWKADTMMNTALHFDATLQVLDPTGAVLAQSHVSGMDDLGGSFWNPPAHAKSTVPPAAQSKLEALLSDTAVANALR